MTYNIIGDIHGKTSWKQLVDDTFINIFVGDYFDPYESIPFSKLKQNFLDIIAYKNEHPDNVVLLYGNHDYQYLPDTMESYSRYDAPNADSICSLLKDNESVFHGVAYAIGDKHIVSHAGVSEAWKIKYLPEITDYTPANMAKAINDLWLKDKSAFGFRNNAELFDGYGESPEHSPIWIRPIYLGYYNLYNNSQVTQIVGHSNVPDITEKKNTIFIDCLDSVVTSLKVTM